MKYLVVRTKRFDRDYKLAKKRGLNLSKLDRIVGLLAMGEPLPASCHDHPLVGSHIGKRECHVAPDWLLVYRIVESEVTLYLLDTGSHADLFG